MFRPEFDRDIRPILAENCYPCHGPDENKRKAKLRLDRHEDAIKPLPNGEVAILPGQPVRSKVIERITTVDSDERMPPAKSGKKLSTQEIDWITQWIKQGAQWQNHWSFVTPSKPAIPEPRKKQWPHNPIDSFVLARLEKEGLSPSPEAPRAILLRRLSLDITGLPPEPSQLHRWLSQSDPVATAQDELLASPSYGERFASDWMDVARYADTHGFNNDVMRSMWRWRDWVIDAFNNNLPYDRFITEQLAGDLLPKPTLDQLIATGFNRNHGINSEGGIIDEEYRVEYVVDRVRTTSIAWLGLTMECARCHDHKFDPISQKDFFRFFAFFNNVDEVGEDGRFANAAPILAAPTRLQQDQIQRLKTGLSSARTKMERLLSARHWEGVSFEEHDQAAMAAELLIASNQLVSLQLDAAVPGPRQVTNTAGGKPFQVAGELVLTNGPLGQVAMGFDGNSRLRTDALPGTDFSKGWAVSFWIRRDQSVDAPIFSTANFAVPPSAEQYGQGLQIRLTESGAVDVRLAHRWPGYSLQLRTRDSLAASKWRHLLLTSDGSMAAKGLHIYIDGQECFRDVIHDDLTEKLGPSGSAALGGSDEKDANHFVGALAGFQIISGFPSAVELAAQARSLALRFAAATPAVLRDDSQVESLHHVWLEQHDPEFLTAANSERAARDSLLALEREAPSTMVMRQLPHERATHVLFRGQYDAPREEVQPDVPGFILPFPRSVPRNRLGLAQWLTDPGNPLTARVVVNRTWQAFFGVGLVKTSENFGYQGEAPSHPELLDWLAVDFIEHGWDLKRLVRQITGSATYRQSSTSTPGLNERDPENRLLAHGPRQRLTGEMLRDQALSLAGLLHNEIGGPPVYPYQPANLYKGIVVAADYPGTSYTESTGDGLYRRSLYTFWKRTVPHPSLSTFDVPDREVCTARRAKTNTPLQALATMNDTFQIESARKLAERMCNQGGLSPTERLSFGFELATARKPARIESKALRSFFDRRAAAYKKDPAAAKAFLSVGASPLDPRLDPVELAAYANVASLILNLDETITRN